MAPTDILLVIFIALAALALLGQFIVLVGMSRRFRDLSAQVTPWLPQVEQSARALPPLVGELRTMVAETRPRLQTLAANIVEISTLAREQAQRADAIATDLGDRLQLQMVRVDEALSTALASVEMVTTSVRDSILRPVQDVNALFHGLRTGLDFFLRRRASPALHPRPAYQDEEMFI
ncbi:MAG: hypothetical protein ACRD01_09285 [Terriglobales bacterium]